jgi:L-amino acid N-acyltransferase YncA
MYWLRDEWQRRKHSSGIDDNKIVGVVIFNQYRNEGFLPENIVYIAVDNSQCGKGYGKQLMQKQYQSLKET